MAVVSMKNLLEAGVHFGHQTRRWDPRMRSYIFTERNGIYIIDLQQTLELIESTYEFVRELTARGGKVLFVGTKKQAQESVVEQATRCDMPYVSYRWLGGMMTNFATVKGRINRLQELDMMDSDGRLAQLSKKEAGKLRVQRDKLQRNLGGISGMTGMPGAIYVVDPRKEQIAVMEANKLGIPIIGLVDTNCNPDEIQHVIPGNDDAIRAIALITKIIADAALAGSNQNVKVAVDEGAAVAADTDAAKAPVVAKEA